MNTVEHWIELFNKFLIESIGIKENSTLAYVVPVRKLLKTYSVKVNKTLLDVSDLADFIAENLQSYPEAVDLIKKYRTFDKAIEYFTRFVEYYFRLSLEMEEFKSGRYQIHTKGLGVINVDDVEIVDGFVSFTKDGKKQFLNSNEVILIKEN